MPLSEKEEFELLSLEREKHASSPKAKAEKPALDKQVEEQLSYTPAEVIAANPIVRAATSAAEPIMGAAGLVEKLWGGTSNLDRTKQLKEMQARGSKALHFPQWEGDVADVAGSTLSPTSVAALKTPAATTAFGRIAQGMGFGALSGVTTPSDKPLQEAKTGALIGAGSSAIPEAIRGTYGFAKPIVERLRAPKTGATEPVSGSAQKVVSELQRTRDVMEHPKTLDSGNFTDLSSPEKLLYEKSRLVDVLNNQIFPNAKPVDLSNSLKAIQQIEGPEVDPGILSAAKEAKKTIERAIEKSGGANPLAGMTADQRKAWGKFLSGQSSAAPKVSLEMADRIRQSLQDDIDRIGAGQLSKRAQSLIANVRDAVTGAATASSKEYGKYLADYGKVAQELQGYSVEGSALSKLTRGNNAFKDLTPADAHNLMAKVFEGETPGRELKQLVDLTGHSKESTEGLRQTFGTWLTKPDPKTNTVTENQLFKRWEQSRDAVEKSGLFAKDHVSNINRVMDDLRKSAELSATKRAASTVGGFFVGSIVGHPFMGAHVARDITTGTSTAASREAIEAAVANATLKPEAAKILSLPPIQENIARAMNLFATEASRFSAEPKPRQKSAVNPFGDLGTDKPIPKALH